MKSSARLWLLLGICAAGFALAQTAGQTGREPQFENAEVKVWKSLVLPTIPCRFTVMSILG